MSRRPSPPRRRRDSLFAKADSSLLELVDHVLNKGIVVSGDLLLGVADVDLIYVKLSAVVCAADRLLAGKGEGKDEEGE